MDGSEGLAMTMLRNVYLTLVLILISASLYAAGEQGVWHINNNDRDHPEAWQVETSGVWMTLTFACIPGGDACGFYLSLPMGCDGQEDRKVAVPIKLGGEPEVAHLECLGEGGWLERHNRGATRVYNMGRLSDDGDPVRIDMYQWGVVFPKYKDQIVPDMDADKRLTFVIGESEYNFSLRGSHRAFKRVHKAVSK